MNLSAALRYLDQHTNLEATAGRAEGLSISFEAHLLGDKVEYDEAAGTLIIKGLPTTLVDQLKRRKD